MPHEGHPQGVPLPIGFSRRFCHGKGTHKGCPYRLASLGVLPRRAPTRGAPTDWLLSAFLPWKGTHKGCPYRLASLGVLPWEGHPQGVPLPIGFSRRFLPWGGHPQGVPLPIGAFLPWEGHPQGVPLPIGFSRRFALRRAPTRGAPTDWLLSAFCPAKGTHKGCPYRLASLGVWPCEGCPQGVPLPIVFSRRLALGRVPTGAPLLKASPRGRAFCPGGAPTRGAPIGD